MTTSATLDFHRVEEFAGKLFELYNSGMLTLMIDVGNRTGLFEALAVDAGTSAEIAQRADLTERYVREWLGAMVTGGIAEYDAATATYSLPPEHAACLTGPGALNLAPTSQVVTLLGRTLPQVAEAFREGGGVPYEAFRPDFAAVMDGMSRNLFDAHLVEDLVPLASGLPDRLGAGISVADIGCGTGHSTNLLAAAFPNSTFMGYDIDADALVTGEKEAQEMGLDNVEFQRLDITRFDPDSPFDAVVAFDVVHDQVDPVTVLRRVYETLAPGGVFLMVDIRASSDLEENRANPLAPFLYSVSTLHCMTVSLAHGGAGLGTVWGEQLARQMLADAGFIDVACHEVPDDPTNAAYVAYKRE
ncbi:class I SAM-dependent methyltransferase [soil metagenome]